MQYIAFDAHKHYTLASVAQPDGQIVREERIEHERVAAQPSAGDGYQACACGCGGCWRGRIS